LPPQAVVAFAVDVTAVPGQTIVWSQSVINRRRNMLKWALVFLVVGIIAAVLGAGGVAGMSMNIAWIIFVIAIILAVIGFVTGRTKV